MKARTRLLSCDSVTSRIRILLSRSVVFGAYVLVGLSVWITSVAAEEIVKIEKLLDFPMSHPRQLTFFSNTNEFFVYHLFQKPNLVYHWSLGQKAILKTYDIGEGYICDQITVSTNGRFALIGCHGTDFTAKV